MVKRIFLWGFLILFLIQSLGYSIGCTYSDGKKCYSICCAVSQICKATGTYGYMTCDLKTGKWGSELYTNPSCTGAPCDTASPTTTIPPQFCRYIDGSLCYGRCCAVDGTCSFTGQQAFRECDLTTGKWGNYYPNEYCTGTCGTYIPPTTTTLQTTTTTTTTTSIPNSPAECTEFSVDPRELTPSQNVRVRISGRDNDSRINLIIGVCRGIPNCGSNISWTNFNCSSFECGIDWVWVPPSIGNYYFYGLVRGRFPNGNTEYVWCNNGQPILVRVSTQTTTTTTTTTTIFTSTTTIITTTIPLFCQFRNCEAPNPPGCFCGVAQTTSALPLCCALNSFVTDNPTQCLQACQIQTTIFWPTTIPTTIRVTTIPTTIVTTTATTTTSIPASCRGRCRIYDPNAKCQCDYACHLQSPPDCCDDICDACPSHPVCLISTTTTTIFSTTTTPTTTTTTTSIPQPKVTCEKNVVLVGEKVNCSIQNCSEGTWFASNKQGKPLEVPIISPIPPYSIEIGPLSNEGLISVVGVCREPSVTSSFDLKVEKGVEINCSSCFVESSCSCEIKNCTYGWLYLTNSKENPLNEDIVRVVSATPYSLVFKPTGAGEILLTLECYSPYKLARTQRIEVKNVCSGAVALNISPSVVSASSLTRAYISGLQYCEGYNVTIRKDSCNGDLACIAKANENCQFTTPSQEGNYTYYACIDKNNDNDYNDPGEQASARIEVKRVEERFKFVNISCTLTKCTFNIENTIKEPVLVVIRLVSVPEGRIHYAANDDVSPGFSGRREVPLLRIRDCAIGTEIRVIAIAFKQSDLENELDKIVKKGFTC